MKSIIEYMNSKWIDEIRIMLQSILTNYIDGDQGGFERNIGNDLISSQIGEYHFNESERTLGTVEMMLHMKCDVLLNHQRKHYKY